MDRFEITLVTCGSRKEARKLARVLVERELAACVNIFATKVDSIYRWKGRTESAREVLLLIKSTRARFAALRREIERLHSYETPEIIAIPIAQGSSKYLRWLAESVRDKPRA